MKEKKLERRYEKPECYTPEENNPYPLCIGGKLPECVNCQLRADWEPDAPYCVCVQIENLEKERNHNEKI